MQEEEATQFSLWFVSAEQGWMWGEQDVKQSLQSSAQMVAIGDLQPLMFCSHPH